jgi:hypothetical protein
VITTSNHVHDFAYLGSEVGQLSKLLVYLYRCDCGARLRRLRRVDLLQQAA